jgi:hypothetical protein
MASNIRQRLINRLTLTVAAGQTWTAHDVATCFIRLNDDLPLIFHRRHSNSQPLEEVITYRFMLRSLL